MKYLLYTAAFICIFIAFACNNVSTTTDAKDSVKDKKAGAPTVLSFTDKGFKNESTPGCDSCARVTVTIPVAEGDAAAAEKINDSVFAVVQSFLGEDGKQFNNYDSLLANFMNMYKRTKAEFPNSASLGWEANIKGSVVKQTGNLVNIKLEAYAFTGGAHPNTNTYSLLFNAVTGNKLTRNDVIKDVPAFTAAAEKKFREQLKIPPGAPINSTIYTFDSNRFALPQNIFFTNNGLVLHYNAYEIAPYYVGSTIITLPYADVQQYLAVTP